MPLSAWRIARIRGVDVRLSPTLGLIAVLLIMLFAPQFTAPYQLEDPIHGYLRAAAFVVALYISVLLHEIAHLAAARCFGMPVESITLHAMGGQTQIHGEMRKPAQEFWTSFIGPLATFGVALIFWFSTLFTVGIGSWVLLLLFRVNVLIGIVNLVPAFPLDGAHAFRALLWKLTRDPVGATVWTGYLGRVIAGLVIAIFAVVLLRSNGAIFGRLDILIAIFLAGFIWMGSSAAIRQAQQQRQLSRLRVRDLVEPIQPGDEDLPYLQIDLVGTDLLQAMSERAVPRYGVRDLNADLIGALSADTVAHAVRKGNI